PPRHRRRGAPSGGGGDRFRADRAPGEAGGRRLPPARHLRRGRDARDVGPLLARARPERATGASHGRAHRLPRLRAPSRARPRALAEGKILYMAVRRLRTEKCFVEIDPQRLGKKAALAASISGACRWGRAVSPREMRPVDLVVCGSVAVGRDGARLGKGGGYCDLEYGLLREEGKVRESTPILTTVHPLQMVAERIT